MQYNTVHYLSVSFCNESITNNCNKQSVYTIQDKHCTIINQMAMSRQDVMGVNSAKDPKQKKIVIESG